MLLVLRSRRRSDALGQEKSGVLVCDTVVVEMTLRADKMIELLHNLATLRSCYYRSTG